jgi:hypothetical protein
MTLEFFKNFESIWWTKILTNEVWGNQNLDKRQSGLQTKHNGKPLHDRKRLVRQSLEDISRTSLDISGCPWASRGSLGIFGDLWGSFNISLIKGKTFQFSHARWDFSISHPRWDFLVFSCRMRLSGFLMQNETFWFSYAGFEFWVFLSYMRLLGFLILLETFRFSYPTWDFRFSYPTWDFLSEASKNKNKYSNLIKFEQIWSSLNQFHLFWTISSILNKFDPVWSSLNMFEHVWTSLINLNQV